MSKTTVVILIVVAVIVVIYLALRNAPSSRLVGIKYINGKKGGDITTTLTNWQQAGL